MEHIIHKNICVTTELRSMKEYKITKYEIYLQDTNTHKASKMSCNNDLYIAVELFPHNL